MDTKMDSSPRISEVTEENFEDLIKQDGITVIDFWAEWCGPCRAFSPIFEKVAAATPDVRFAKCNTEEQQGLARGLAIRSIPTLMVFKDNVMIYEQSGLVPEEALIEVINKARDLDMVEVHAELATTPNMPGAEA